jgi:ABC-2 type transport system permease protein
MNAEGARSMLRKSLVVARREFLWRGRSRTFVISTVVLVAVAVAVALAPTILRLVNRLDTGDRIAVYVGATAPSVDMAPALELLLNATAEPSPSSASGAPAAPSTGGFKVETASDLEAARAEVGTGRLKAVLALQRTASGDLGFQLYSSMMPFDRTAQVIRQAVASLTIQDRLTRAGVPPGDQATIFAAPQFEFLAAVPKASAGPAAGATEEQAAGSFLVIGFALPMLIFTAIVVYGQWVAMSVAEEKSSRVMEIVLGAARPFELMTGKVVGVGALAIAQYVAVGVPTGFAILFQDRIAAFVLGGTASAALPPGLTIPILLAFGVFFVLGFALYATLFAGVASLVSRQEDVSQLITPFILVATVGYLVAAYTSSGLIPIDAPVVIVLSYIPFLSPYLMLSRMTTGGVLPFEPAVAVAILVASVVVALWFAGRLYAAGVLMYGQKPGLRAFVQALRTS